MWLFVFVRLQGVPRCARHDPNCNGFATLIQKASKLIGVETLIPQASKWINVTTANVPKSIRVATLIQKANQEKVLIVSSYLKLIRVATLIAQNSDCAFSSCFKCLPGPFGSHLGTCGIRVWTLIGHGAKSIRLATLIRNPQEISRVATLIQKGSKMDRGRDPDPSLFPSVLHILSPVCIL